jgi:hypothetical protein
MTGAKEMLSAVRRSRRRSGHTLKRKFIGVGPNVSKPTR